MLCRPVRPDRPLRTIAKSIYSTRGWTFQERLLSGRCLFFLSDQMYFQCKTELWCEEPQILQSPFMHLSADAYAKATLNSLTQLSEWADDIGRHAWSPVFEFYAQFVSEYSNKRFSYPADVLRAMTGILSSLEAHSGWRYIYGIPEPLIELCLLWTSYKTPIRRHSPQEDEHTIPTWAWAGWIGRVNFGLVFKGRKIQKSISCLKDLSVGTRDEKWSISIFCYQ